jgi:hypothetical protein
MRIRFEQAVYGSFPFWNRGYGVLAHSEGCRPEWLAELRAVCQRYGEPPTGATRVDSLIALRLQSGPWLVAGVHSQGTDDRGRPGALAFHALFLGRWAYCLAGGDPFFFANEIRNDWRAEHQGRGLSSGRMNIGRSGPSITTIEDDPRAGTVTAALSARRRVLVLSSAPIDSLARVVWGQLPHRVRMRRAIATWAFDIANSFDLVALPKLTGLVLNPSDLILANERVP